MRLTGSHSYYGRCCPKGSLRTYDKYDYYIEISGHILENTERSQRNILIHELIHTVPEGLCHTGEWRKWAKYVSEKTGYNIKRLGADETEEDYRRFVAPLSR
ncbi:MAG: SprT-like domain-containing protein [Bacteroidales bacterium]|nr:SprT-like domain-containing protein [Bacteroidales bacterium]